MNEAKIAKQIDEASEEVSKLSTRMAVLGNKYEENRKALQSEFANAVCRLTTLTGILASNQVEQVEEVGK